MYEAVRHARGQHGDTRTPCCTLLLLQKLDKITLVHLLVGIKKIPGL